MRTSKSLRLHIGLFGRRNVGKSSLLNALTRQKVAIVSSEPGTTTDPVEKPMEMLPLGPVLFIDTAGMDDAGSLGQERIRKTMLAVDRTDLAVIVTDGEWGGFERDLFRLFRERGVPALTVRSKCDLDKEIVGEGCPPAICVSAETGEGLDELRKALLEAAPEDWAVNPPLLADLVEPGQHVVLVTPIDKEAPKGRLILPQVQCIRELLDIGAVVTVVKESELPLALANSKTAPALVVTDSQAFAQVAAATPPAVWLTSFSILFARAKGDLHEFTRGALAIDRLQAGSIVLICEACTHHPIGEDIGRVKIPAWLQKRCGANLEFAHYSGRDYPSDLAQYALIVHCGGCMHNRRTMLCRVDRARQAGVPITNYGMAIAYSLGIFERALQPFPSALELCHQLQGP